MSFQSDQVPLLINTGSHANADRDAGTSSPYTSGATDTLGTRTIPITFGIIGSVLTFVAVVLAVMQYRKKTIGDEERSVNRSVVGPRTQSSDEQDRMLRVLP